METFNWRESYTSEAAREPRVRGAKFGDGYEQRAVDGLNPLPQAWSLVFSRCEESIAREIDEFLQARGGWEAFFWNPPNTLTTIKIICRKWSLRLDEYATQTVTASFEQVFDP